MGKVKKRTIKPIVLDEGHQIGIYRTNDSFDNLKIKFTLRKISTSDLTWLDKDDVDLEVLTSVHKTDENKLERVFTWQEKVFNRNEIIFYSEDRLSYNFYEKVYHEDVKALITADNPYSPWYTYTNNDLIRNIEINIPFLWPNKEEAYLRKKIKNMRLKSICPRFECDQPTSYPDGKIVTTKKASSEDYELDQSFYQTMYIMADLAPEGSDKLDEALLCTLRINKKGLLIVSPDFSDEAYTLRSSRNEGFKYTLQNISLQRETALLEEAALLFEDKKVGLQTSLPAQHPCQKDVAKPKKAVTIEPPSISGEKEEICTDFEIPEHTELTVYVYGEIVSAQRFSYNSLFVHYLVNLSSDWQIKDEGMLTGVTQTSHTKSVDIYEVAYYGHPFYIELHLTRGLAAECPNKIPQLFLEVVSLDRFRCYRVEGYGHVDLPSEPGMHKVTVETWRPILRNPTNNLMRHFIGGCPELNELEDVVPNVPKEEKIISRLGFLTKASGSVTLKFNILHLKNVKEADVEFDKSGFLQSAATLASISKVISAFKNARQRMMVARSGIETLDAKKVDFKF